MKPDEEMHAAVEEVDLEPCDLFVDLGILIVEGRIPGLTERGYGEGNHCPPPQGQNRHQCDPTSPKCQRFESMQKHMLLLWRNGIPMSIEVLLYPDCCATSTKSPNVDTSSVPDMSYILLEQWTVHMLRKRVPDATINPRGLLHAVRSFLHFSQLCAWLSLTGGKSPQNVHYRICVPGEAFSCKFNAEPDIHMFPVANIGRSNAMKVCVKSIPRCGKIPMVVCEKHSLQCTMVKAARHAPRNQKLEALPEESVGSEEDDDVGEYDGIPPTKSCDGIVASKFIPPKSRTNSPADSLLGESLLDPPHSFQMYPKRYQSPSRCGSPSLEVPEHLMFGKGAATRREAERQRLQPCGKDRSRSQRRPVIERFLNKSLQNEVCASSSCKVLSESDVNIKFPAFHDKDVTKVHQDKVEDYISLSGDPSSLPAEEIECVLNHLRQQCPRIRCKRENSKVPHHTDNKELDFFARCNEKTPSCLDVQSSNTAHISAPSCSAQLMQNQAFNKLDDVNKASTGASASNTKFPSANLKQSTLDLKTAASPNVAAVPYAQITKQKPLSRTCKFFMGISNEKEPKKLVQDSVKYQHNLFSVQKEPMFENNVHKVANIAATNNEDINKDVYIFSKDNNNSFKCTYQHSHAQLNNGDKCKEPPISHLTDSNLLPYTGTWPEELKRTRTKSTQLSTNNSLLHLLLKSSRAASVGHLEIDCNGHLVPSAEEKAQFRRSLDSATSLVFHQKTGLPLTSSPAPIRKSGTCFDFDSSLTTVSAIKKALFEKEPEEEEISDRLNYLSTSAPASTTISSLLGSFEESVLNGRLEPVNTVHGFRAEIGASGSFCPRHIILPVTVFFYTLHDTEKVASPYLGHINLGKKGYHIPKKGTVQVTLFNPHQTVVKMFVVRYELCDMPGSSQTFLRQRTLYMPSDASEDDVEARKWLRYLIHLRFVSSKSGRVYLHTDIRMIIFRKSDLDAATVHGQRPYELRSFTHGPSNPKFSPHKQQ